jgi:hypothetical protein
MIILEQVPEIHISEMVTIGKEISMTSMEIKILPSATPIKLKET